MQRQSLNSPPSLSNPQPRHKRISVVAISNESLGNDKNPQKEAPECRGWGRVTQLPGIPPRGTEVAFGLRSQTPSHAAFPGWSSAARIAPADWHGGSCEGPAERRLGLGNARGSRCTGVGGESREKARRTRGAGTEQAQAVGEWAGGGGRGSRILPAQDPRG